MGKDPLIGQVVDGRWRILDRLGAGGMGVVYKAERIKIFKMVALKFLEERFADSPEAILRFERETRAISRLQHRHVVSILDFGVHERRPYIVMEYLSGQPLNKLVGRPTMTLPRAVNIVCQILEALRHAHKAGVVHRDLKPENVMLVEMTGTEDYVKILDFGLARIISLDEISISHPERVAGTPGYMSPEQIKNDKVDHRADLYAAGIMLYALCVGDKPFKAADDLDVLRQHLNLPPVPPRKAAPERNISAPLERVILRAIEKNRDQRFFSAEEMWKALRATPEGGGKIVKRRRGRTFAALLLLAAGVGAGLYGRRFLQQEPPPPLLPPPPPIASPPPPRPIPTPAPLVVVDASEAVVDAAAAPPVVDAATVPPSPVPQTTAPETTAQKIEALLESEQLADAERYLLAQQILEPRAAWVHLDLGELYYRRLWRRDALREWELAVQMEPSLRKDARLQRRLCAILAPGWKGAGEHFVVVRVGRDALDAMQECIRVTDDADRLRAAARVLERVGLRGKIDRALVNERLESLLHPR
jgi:eukaryotic-like serine/threonine-protein kinase